MIENLADPQSHLGALNNVGRRSRIEVKHDHCGTLDIFGECKRGMQFQRSQIRHTDQRGQVLRQNEVDIALIPMAPDGRSFHPIRPVHGRILLEEEFGVYSLWITLHGEWASCQMRQQRWRNPHVIIDHLALGESCRWIQYFVQIGEL